MIIVFIMAILTRLSLLVRRIARRVRRALLCPLGQARRDGAREELMEAGLLAQQEQTSCTTPAINHRSGYVEKEIRAPSIQMSSIEVLRKGPHKPANQSSLMETSQGDVLLDASAVKDTIRHVLASKHGIDKEKLATIIRMQKEHAENELEGPVLIDPVRLL